MNAEAALNALGVIVTRRGGGVGLSGLDRLTPDERGRAIELARSHKAELEALFTPAKGRERVARCCKQCFPCQHWQKIPGGCWWIGTCGITGKRRGFRNTCTMENTL